jgi:hypothetical protein
LIPQYSEDADHQQHDHQRLRHNSSARKNAIGNEQIEKDAEHGCVWGDYSFGDQVQENPTNHPEQRGQEPWDPEVFTPEDEVGEGSHEF